MRAKKTHWARCLKPYSPKPYSTRLRVLNVLFSQRLRRFFVICDVFARYFFVDHSDAHLQKHPVVAFPWLFRGPRLPRKTVFVVFRVLFSIVLGVFLWPSFWIHFTHARPAKVF